ncbi:TatD family hydrolase [Paraglaciecola sp. 2405UD69-4]|uniref:TatD family hydrolase n=1 Tax=Paraglaciecola sp. 2405UD69-4 TaxID=3391836 RepID=UPI0039C9BE97
MSLVDIGVNLTDKRLERTAVIERAINASVSKMIVTGSSLESSKEARTISTQYQNTLYCTAGVHPHHAKEYTEQTTTELRALTAHPEVVAIGECGLDFNRNFSTPTEQLYAFEQQLQLACDLKLPVFLHERDAFDEQIKLLKQYRTGLVGGVAHCFTGSSEQMAAYLDLDLYIGITGWFCDPKRGQALREAIPSLPLKNLLLETDAPYLRPKGLANNRKLDKGNNEPAYLPYIAAELANLMEIEQQELQQASYYNTCKLFPKIEAGIESEY